MRALLTPVLAAALALVLPAAAGARRVTDMGGRVVEIPDRVTRVGCLEVLCYPRMFMLGADGRIATLLATGAPWMTATNPRAAAIPAYHGDANVEDLAALGVDVAFIRYDPERTAARLAAAGIPALISQPYPRDADSPEAFLADLKRGVRLFGTVLGGTAAARAEDWCAYVDERAAFLASRLAGLPAGERVRLYYVRGPQALNTQGRGGYTYWSGLLAGADMVAGRAAPMSKGSVSMEDVIAWDPQVVLVGRQYPLELVTADPRWRDVTAVRDGRVISTPEGVWYWDGGPEMVLHMQFVAKTLYPGRFAGFDFAEEVRRYYARFYRVHLSDDALAKLLDGRSPDGSRSNPFNN